MRILTNEQLRKMQDDYYSRGYRDANKAYYNAGWTIGAQEKTEHFELICNRILSELNELQRNTWDQDRIKKIKEMIND